MPVSLCSGAGPFAHSPPQWLSQLPKSCRGLFRPQISTRAVPLPDCSSSLIAFCRLPPIVWSSLTAPLKRSTPPSRISPVLQHHPLKNSLVAPITFYTVTHLLVCHLSSPFGCKQHEGEPCVSCALTQCRPVSRPSEYLLNERMNCGFIFLSVFSALLVHKYIFTSHISKRCFNVRG